MNKRQQKKQIKQIRSLMLFYLTNNKKWLLCSRQRAIWHCKTMAKYYGKTSAQI